MKKLLFSILLLASMAFTAQGQNIFFNFNDGATETYSLADVRRITFVENILNLDLNDGTIYQWDISGITSFQFEGNVTGVDAGIKTLNMLDVKLFPNPNNGGFQLEYTLSNASPIEASIIAADGRLVTSLFSGSQSAGVQRINAELNGIAAGIYTCRIQGEGFTVNKKLIIK